MIKLSGCKPEPLAHYLKALGVLRLVVEQELDPQAKGYWHDHSFFLDTNITEQQLLDFFLNEYRPTPIISPWNGGSGFYEETGNKRKILNNIVNSTHQRFLDYRESIKTGDAVIGKLGLTKELIQKDKTKKRDLVIKLREELSDLALAWLDTAACLTGDELKHAPLLGTGGNDGNLEFSKVFMEQIQTVLDCATGKPTAIATDLLQAALFDKTISQLKFSGASGQFNPWADGGYNAAPGFDGDSRTNPWDYILMLKGSLLFVSGVTRKHENQKGEFVYPFTVRPAKSGYGSATDTDADRGELWTPLWEQPAALAELKMLFSEGRVKVQRKFGSSQTARTARDAVDFALALSQQGTRRWITEFVRYSFQERNGKMYLAVPLGRFQPKTNPQADLLGEIDRYRENLRRVAQGKNCPSSIQQVYRQLERIIIEFASGKRGLLDVLIALGAIEKALSRSRSSLWDENFSRYSIQPLYPLSSKWVIACNDNSAEFRLALSLASWQNITSRQLRQRLGYVRLGKWLPPIEEDRVTTWQQGSLEQNLVRWLQRESIEENRQLKDRDAKEENIEKKEQNRFTYFANLADINQWILGDIKEERVEAIARGLALAQIDWKCTQEISRTDGDSLDLCRSPFYILEGKDKSFLDTLIKELAIPAEGAVDFHQLAVVLAKYDFNSLLHGIFLAKKEIAGGRFKLSRALAGFIEAKNVETVASGGVKNDRVNPSADAKKGGGNIPYHKDEYTAEEITAYFSLDLRQICGYRLDPEVEDLLIAIALYKILAFLDTGLRLRTSCDLECVSAPIVKRPNDFQLPTLDELTKLLPALVKKCSSVFANPAITEVEYDAVPKEDKNNKPQPKNEEVTEQGENE
jgi:CRISPR-associated protein Csx17